MRLKAALLLLLATFTADLYAQCAYCTPQRQCGHKRSGAEQCRVDSEGNCHETGFCGVWMCEGDVRESLLPMKGAPAALRDGLVLETDTAQMQTMAAAAGRHAAVLWNVMVVTQRSGRFMGSGQTVTAAGWSGPEAFLEAIAQGTIARRPAEEEGHLRFRRSVVWSGDSELVIAIRLDSASEARPQTDFDYELVARFTRVPHSKRLAERDVAVFKLRGWSIEEVEPRAVPEYAGLERALQPY